MSPVTKARGRTVAMMAILLLAFALRAYHLDFQSFWSDEGISLQRSGQPLARMLAGMPIEQLPGYFVLFRAWLLTAGDQDFALRFFSLWPSVLTVALLYRLAVDLAPSLEKRTWARRTGLIAALLLAVNPLQIWYAQEARTYGWLLLSATWSTWSFWRLLTLPQNSSARTSLFPFFNYVFATTLTVYLHYHGFLLPVMHTVFAIGWLIVRREWRGFLRWAAAGAVIFLLFLPWLPRALQIFGFQGWREPIEPWQIPWRFWAAYTVGDAMPAPWNERLPWLYLVLAGVGLILWGRQRLAAALLLLISTAGPIAAVFAYALRQPDTHERYTLFVTPPLLLLVAGGIAMLLPSAPLSRWRKMGGQVGAGLLVGVLTFASGTALYRYFTDTALFLKPDYRATAQAIMAQEQPGDVILVDGPDPNLVFLHYYKGNAPVHDLRFLADAEFATIDSELTTRTANAPRAWEVLYFHEPGPIQFWLATRGWTVPPTEYNGIRLTLYGLPNAAEPIQPQLLDIAFGPTLILHEAAVTPATARPGRLVRVTTHWQTVAQSPELKFSMRLNDANGQPVQTQDYGPQNWFTPTSAWPVGEITADQRGFLLPPTLTPGNYHITLRLYDPTNGAAVETSAGQDVLLGDFVVTAQ